MDGMRRSVRFALRRLRRSPAQGVLALVTLALGLGAAAAIADLGWQTLAGPLPYPDGERLVFLWSELERSGYDHAPFSGPELGDLEDRSTQIAELGAVWPTTGALVQDAAGREPQSVSVGLVTERFFPVLGVSPSLGRSFLPEDGHDGAPQAMLISNRLWRTRFGGDPDIVGRTLRVDGGWGFGGGSFTVVGVLPESFRLLLPAAAGVSPTLDVWIPFGFDLRDGGRRTFFLRVVGRLAPGATAAGAAAEVASIGRAVVGEHPQYADNGRAFHASSLREELTRSSRPLLLALLAGAACLVVLCGADVAHIMLARAAPRRAELAVRLVQGASRSQLRGELMVEAALLALLGVLAGTAVAAAGLRALPALLPYPAPDLASGSFGAPAFAALIVGAAAVTLVVGALVGRAIPRDGLAEVLRGAATGGSKADWRGREALVATQVAVGTMLLVAAGLLGRTFVELLHVDRGFDQRGVLTFQLTLPGERYGSVGAIARLSRELERRLGRLPGVLAVGAVNQLPLDRLPNWSTPYATRAAGSERAGSGEADARLISPGYLDAVGAELVAGRFFDDADDERGRPVAIVDELFAARAWPGRRAVGQEVEVRAWRLGGFEPVWAEVVGVVAHARHHDLTRAVREQVYLPLLQSSRNQLAVVVRSYGDLAALAAPVRRELAAIDRELAAFRFEPLASYVARATAAQRMAMVLAGTFALFALLLAGLGIYGVLSQLVSERTREIGVRMALGSRPSGVVGMMTRQGARPVLAGLLLGIACSLALARALESLLYGVAPSDPGTYLASALVVVAMAALALGAPARRAAGVDPLVALRHS
jgi:putative ABC transport system permease protein